MITTERKTVTIPAKVLPKQNTEKSYRFLRFAALINADRRKHTRNAMAHERGRPI